MNEWADRDFGDEDDFYLDDEEYWPQFPDNGNETDDSDLDIGGSLVPNKPYPNKPSLGDAIKSEEQLVLC